MPKLSISFVFFQNNPNNSDNNCWSSGASSEQPSDMRQRRLRFIVRARRFDDGRVAEIFLNTSGRAGVEVMARTGCHLYQPRLAARNTDQRDQEGANANADWRGFWRQS
jgi:hypothetical protein